MKFRRAGFVLCLMAWHNRYITLSESAASTSKVRLSVEFRRHDLLWICPYPLINPFTGETFALPMRIGDTVAVGSNILDMILRETRQMWSDEELTAEDGTLETVRIQVEKLIWRLRQPEELFATKVCDTAENHPLKKSLCTGGLSWENRKIF